jgi:hypothetical protein
MEVAWVWYEILSTDFEICYDKYHSLIIIWNNIRIRQLICGIKIFHENKRQ